MNIGWFSGTSFCLFPLLLPPLTLALFAAVPPHRLLCILLHRSPDQDECGTLDTIPKWKAHQENNILLGSLEVLESAGLTGVARSSFKFL